MIPVPPLVRHLARPAWQHALHHCVSDPQRRKILQSDWRAAADVQVALGALRASGTALLNPSVTRS
jgi:hypothetical protein